MIHTIRNTSSYHKYHPKTNILNPENLMASYIDVTFIFLLWLFSGFKMLLPVSGGGGCKYPTDNRGISHPSDLISSDSPSRFPGWPRWPQTKQIMHTFMDLKNKQIGRLMHYIYTYPPTPLPCLRGRRKGRANQTVLAVPELGFR